MHICILGAGGLGSVIGARLAEAGHEVTLVARPAHVDAIRRDGLRLDGIRGAAIVRDGLRAVAHPDDVEGSVDYLILLVKTRDTDVALDSAMGLRDRTAVALSLQNSVTKDERLRSWAGDRTIGASTTEAGTLVAPGVVRHTATAPIAFYFGEIDGTVTPRVEALVDVFTAGGFGARATHDIAHVEWEKLLQISLMSAFSVTAVGFLPDATVADALQVRPGAEHFVQLATELLAVYRALGFEPCDFFAPYSQFRDLADSDLDSAVERALALGRSLAEGGVRGRPSLHDDLLRGRPTEVDDSLGSFLSAADRCGIDVATVRAAYRVIRTLEHLAAEAGRVHVPA